jgi:hypothetical protein
MDKLTANTAIATIGIDLAKKVFQLHAVDSSGKVVLRRAAKRRELLAFAARLPPCVIGMEACATAASFGDGVDGAHPRHRVCHDGRCRDDSSKERRPHMTVHSIGIPSHPVSAGHSDRMAIECTVATPTAPFSGKGTRPFSISPSPR